MKYTKFFFFLLALNSVSIAFGQSKQQLQIAINYRDVPLQLGKNYALPQGDSVQFSMLRFYLSSIVFYQNDTAVWSEKNSFHLVNYVDNQSLALNFDMPQNLQFNRVKCNLGIDSLTNEAGVLGGDLDPLKGMYWAWQSGYINAKIEGKSKQCPTRKNEFQFHLGGYLAPFYAMQQLDFKLPKTSSSLTLRLDLALFLEKIDLQKQHNIMSPSAEAVKLATRLAACFQMNTNE